MTKRRFSIYFDINLYRFAREKEALDDARTHGYRLPAKWIERDGRGGMALLFSWLSRYDAFCVRGMRLEDR